MEQDEVEVACAWLMRTCAYEHMSAEARETEQRRSASRGKGHNMRGSGAEDKKDLKVPCRHRGNQSPGGEG